LTACPDGPHLTLALQLSYRVNHLVSWALQRAVELGRFKGNEGVF